MKDTWLKIITRAWNEPAFKTRLLTDTDDVLKEYQLTIPPGVTYQVVEDEAAGKRYLVLPPAPSPGLSDISNRDAASGDPGF
jgi:hypothetical protein